MITVAATAATPAATAGMAKGTTAPEAQLLAQAALEHSPLHALQRLRVELAGDLVRIAGTVSCFYHKQLAQETVRCVIGQVELINSVCVDGPPVR